MTEIEEEEEAEEEASAGGVPMPELPDYIKTTQSNYKSKIEID